MRIKNKLHQLLIFFGINSIIGYYYKIVMFNSRRQFHQIFCISNVIVHFKYLIFQFEVQHLNFSTLLFRLIIILILLKVILSLSLYFFIFQMIQFFLAIFNFVNWLHLIIFSFFKYPFIFNQFLISENQFIITIFLIISEVIVALNIIYLIIFSQFMNLNLKHHQKTVEINPVSLL